MECFPMFIDGSEASLWMGGWEETGETGSDR